MYQKGFTLVELIIVFSIIALLSIAGIASFVDFTHRQELSNTASELKTLFTVARTETISQVNGNSKNSCTSAEKFGGYVVVVCCRTTVDPTNPLNQTPMSFCPTIGCSGTNDYELYEACQNTISGVVRYPFMQGKTLPRGVVIASSTTARTYAFSPITGTVTFGGAPGTAGKIDLYLYSAPRVTQSTVVSSIGTIQ